MRVLMTRSFKDPNARIPNFGVEGAIPQPRPWWADFDHWRVVPPASPPWSPPPSPPQGPDPFDVPLPMPAPLRPRSDGEERSAESELIDWLFRPRRADRSRSARPLPSVPGIDGLAPDLFDQRPWRYVQSHPDLVQQPLPFYASQLDALLRRRPEELVRLTGDTPSRGVQPPIFFPFD